MLWREPTTSETAGSAAQKRVLGGRTVAEALFPLFGSTHIPHPGNHHQQLGAITRTPLEGRRELPVRAAAPAPSASRSSRQEHGSLGALGRERGCGQLLRLTPALLLLLPH